MNKETSTAYALGAAGAAQGAWRYYLSPQRQPDAKSGDMGWIGLAAAVVAFELLSPETLTHAFHRHMEDHPAKKFMMIGTLGVVATHLSGHLPRRFDPFYLCRE